MIHAQPFVPQYVQVEMGDTDNQQFIVYADQKTATIWLDWMGSKEVPVDACVEVLMCILVYLPVFRTIFTIFRQRMCKTDHQYYNM